MRGFSRFTLKNCFFGNGMSDAGLFLGDHRGVRVVALNEVLGKRLARVEG